MSDNKINERHKSVEKTIGERVNGPANIRDSIAGRLLFTLNDNVRVTCTPLTNNWYVIGLLMDIDTAEFGIDTLEKGRRILVDGVDCGTIHAPMEVSTGRSGSQAWATLIGYTHKDNIKPETIIENALHTELAKKGSRTLKSLRSFIDRFGLEKDQQFDGYTLYVKDEHWIDDPSPMWRIGLIFQQDMLVGILHSRPFHIDKTTDYGLDRGFNCLLYDDTKNKAMLLQTFNQFVNAVD